MVQQSVCAVVLLVEMKRIGQNIEIWMHIL